MAEIGTLGDIVFKVSANKVRTFDDLKIDSKTNYAKHTRHLKKPLLEFQYNDADTASLTIYLSAFLGVNPKKMQNKIDKYRKKGKILTLVIGGKKYGSQWVITGHTKDYEKFDNQGNLLIAKSTLSLEQYARGRKAGRNEFYDRYRTGTAYKPCTSNTIRGSNTKCLVFAILVRI